MEKSPKLYLVRGLLIGIFVGQMLMLPHVYKWMKYPVEYALPVPDSLYYKIGERDYTIKDVITKDHSKPTDLLVRIMPIVKIRTAYQKINPAYDSSLLMGFYIFDEENNRHVVYSPDDSDILKHEIRHAFEGAFHRSMGDVFWCPGVTHGVIEND